MAVLPNTPPLLLLLLFPPFAGSSLHSPPHLVFTAPILQPQLAFQTQLQFLSCFSLLIEVLLVPTHHLSTLKQQMSPTKSESEFLQVASSTTPFSGAFWDTG